MSSVSLRRKHAVAECRFECGAVRHFYPPFCSHTLRQLVEKRPSPLFCKIELILLTSSERKVGS